MIMITLRHPRFDFLVSIGCIALLGYFAWHALYGHRGQVYVLRLEAEIARLKADLEQSKAQKDRLRAKVEAMRPESVDADLLDELARSELNWVGRDDLIIRLK
jgi:cell division protein FtsB